MLRPYCETEFFLFPVPSGESVLREINPEPWQNFLPYYYSNYLLPAKPAPYIYKHCQVPFLVYISETDFHMRWLDSRPYPQESQHWLAFHLPFSHKKGWNLFRAGP